MANDGDLNAKDVAELLTSWKKDYKELIDKIDLAAGRLDSSRKAFEGSKDKFFCKSNSPLIAVIIAILCLLLAGLFVDNFHISIGPVKVIKETDCSDVSDGSKTA